LTALAFVFAEPEVSDGRVFVYHGEVHIIPVARSPAELTPIPSSLRPDIDVAVSTVVKFWEITRASEAVQVTNLDGFATNFF